MNEHGKEQKTSLGKIVLVNFPSQDFVNDDFEDNYGYNPSFSLITLGTWLDMHGYEVELIDLFAEPMRKEDFLARVLKDELLFLGVSIHTENSNMSLSTIREIKKLKKDLTVVVGGAHASLCPEDMLSAEGVDFVSINEGEGTLLELAEALRTDQRAIRFENIYNLAYRRDGETIYTSPRDKISDMDVMPIIKRELVDIKRYGRIVNMISGRGCPGRCIYCAATILSGKKYRARSIENVYLEIVLIKYLLGDKLETIYFVDDTFTVNRKRVLQFVSYLKQYNMKIEWMCQSRVDQIDTEVIDALAETGCKQLLYGVESGNQEVITKIGKSIKLDRVLEVMEYTHSKNIHIQCSFILGHYCDTKETMEDTYSLVKYIYDRFKADIAIYLNTPYPGTVQYDNREKLGIRIMEKDYGKYTNLNPIIETDNFTREDQLYYHGKCIGYFARYMKLESEKEKLMKSMR